MTTGMKRLSLIGTIVAALVLSAPAYGNPAMPEDYQLPAVGSATVARADDFQPPSATQALVSGDEAFDWSRLGIVGGIGLALAALGGAALTIRTRERVAHP